MTMPTYPDFISNRFTGKEVHVVASGPSLLGFDYSQLKGKTVIAVNYAYKFVEHDFVVYVDKGFPKEALGITEETTCLSRPQRTFPPTVGLKILSHFTMDPKVGVYGGIHQRSSGVAALCIALQGGAEHVYIYGMDCKFFSREEALAAARFNGAPESIVTLDRYGHSTSGVIPHKRDDEDADAIFQLTAKLFNVFPRDKVTNQSPFSLITKFKKPIINVAL